MAAGPRRTTNGLSRAALIECTMHSSLRAYKLISHMLPKVMLETAARRFALLADASRLRVVHELLEAGEASVGELAAATTLSQPNVSQHLARLAAGGLVAGRRQGTRVLYRVTDPTVEELCSLVCRAERERLERTLVEIERQEVTR